MLKPVPIDIRERIETALRDFVDGATPELVDIAPELEAIMAAASSFVLGGGKRLRPAFCYWAARAVGASDSGSIVRAAASLELLQACALVHDDVIDNSAIRRGKPSVHELFAAHHTSQSWTGDPAQFGAATAILLGDLFLVWSDTMLAASGVGEAALIRARPTIDSMRVELMAGQYLDVVEQARGGGSVERALRVARFKAAKYTVERPLHLGAALGDGSAEAFSAFSEYGLPVGEAFQLRDDLLGVFGDPAVTGKPAGDDLREGKRTVLVALTMDAASPTERALLEREIGNPNLTPDRVAEIRDIVSRSGAAAEVESIIDERVTVAVKAIESAELDAEACAALVALATASTRRTG